MSFQEEDGRWSGQLYYGKWVSTTYFLLLLSNFGIIPNDKTQSACHQLIIGGLYNDEEIRDICKFDYFINNKKVMPELL